jgi:hypothetical protein
MVLQLRSKYGVTVLNKGFLNIKSIRGSVPLGIVELRYTIISRLLRCARITLLRLRIYDIEYLRNDQTLELLRLGDIGLLINKFLSFCQFQYTQSLLWSLSLFTRLIYGR